MRVRLQGPLASYELRHWSEREADEELERFVDEYAAASLLRRMLDEDRGVGFGLRSLVERSDLERGGFGRNGFGLAARDEDELIADVAAALVRGTIIAVRTPHEVMLSHTPELLEPELEEHGPQEIVEPESVWMRPQADSEWLSLSVSAEPELLGLETSHQAP